MVADALFDAASAAARTLPADWRRPGRDRLLGLLRGNHARYSVAISIVASRLFHVKVTTLEAIPADAAARVGQACMDANWQMPTAGFSYAPAGEGAVTNQAAIALDRSPSLPDPGLYRNLLRECVLNAELLALVTRAVGMGTSVEHARTFRSELFPALYKGELGGLPRWLAPDGAPPAGSTAVIDACQAAARAAGWETARNAPDQAVIVCAGSPATGAVHTIVDVHERSLIVSSFPLPEGRLVPEDRRDAVALLFNGILQIGTPFGLALDLQTGNVLARSFLELSGLETIPSPELLCDVIFQSAAGAFLYHEPLVAVAHEGVDPDEALATHVAKHQPGRSASQP